MVALIDGRIAWTLVQILEHACRMAKRNQPLSSLTMIPVLMAPGGLDTRPG